jgi:hypothetical protein
MWYPVDSPYKPCTRYDTQGTLQHDLPVQDHTAALTVLDTDYILQHHPINECVN